MTTENSSTDNKRQIKTIKRVYPQIYSYILPGLSANDGWQKVGYTERHDVNDRIREQTQTAGLKVDYQLLWHASAAFKTPANSSAEPEFFTDKNLHHYYKQNGIEQSKRQDDGGLGKEWFYFDGTPERSKELFDNYTNRNYNSFSNNDSKHYTLRSEQEAAVSQTLDYAATHQTTDFDYPNDRAKYLWNAKPRFGKTLAAYDFAKRFNAKNVLIVTNRPAIANSWFDDYKKFVSGYYFISTTDSLKERKTLSRDEFIGRAHQSPDDRQITFLSLQDLKGGKVFGGNFNKLQWVADLNWDLLIIDEAHEGVDTERTDVAFTKIKRRFTIHLSGTPFKALAKDGYFQDDQIFNWTYLDEQKAKQAELASSDDGESGDHVNLPDLRLFTYKISDMISHQLEQGIDIDGVAHDYAFDLNEMFATNKDGRFVHEDDVNTFLNQLTTNDKYPFSTPELRNELKHTFWLVGNRVASAKAMERLLRKHPIFKDYKIVLAAGDGLPNSDDDTSDEEMQNINANEKAYDRVKKAIKNYDKTITLSVGQLTTGVTVKEWSAVLMLSDIKSSSLYMQAIFRSQNPWHYTDANGNTYRKQSAYVFDFSPNRVLRVYDEFANSLLKKVVGGEVTEATRRSNIAELLNYFPVIAEDRNGEMIELDAEQVLTFPKAILAKEVVDNGFHSSLLFNISNVFNIPAEVMRSLNKSRSTSNADKPINKKPVEHNPDRTAQRDHRISANKAKLLGNKIYGRELQDAIAAAVNDTQAEQLGDKIIEEYCQIIDEPLVKFKEMYSPTKTELEKIKKSQMEKARLLVDESISDDIYKFETQTKLATKLADLIKEDLPNDTVIREENEDYQNDERNELDQVRAKLRTFARAIPSFVMASKVDIDQLTIDNIENAVSDADFEELFTEKGGEPFTKDDFRKLRDPADYEVNGKIVHFDGLFDKYTFNAAIREFEERRQNLADYLQSDTNEDIFSYIRPLKTNQIFTPRRVVNMMLDMLEQNEPGIFSNPGTTFMDPYVKSGLFLAEIAKRLNRNLESVIPDRDERIKHILEHQLYGFAPTQIIHDIAEKYIFGNYRNINTSNLKQLDLTEPFKRGDTMGMKFDVVVGNPPYHYETGRRKIPLYQNFMMIAADSKFANVSCLVTPDGFVKGGQQLEPLRDYLIENKHLKYIEFHRDVIFPGYAVDAAISVFDNNDTVDNPIKTIVHNDGHKERGILDWRYRDVVIDNSKYAILRLYETKIKPQGDTSTQPGIMSDVIPGWAPFGLNTKCYKTNIDKFVSQKDTTHYIRILVGEGKSDFYWINPNDDFSYDGSDGRIEFVKLNNSDKWKMVFPKAGLVNEKPLATRILRPGEIFTDKYLCIFANSEQEAKNAEKYFNSKFYRAGLYSKTTSWNLYRQWHSNVPLQNFTSNSDIDWSKSIPEIDQQLYRKYGLSDEEIAFIEKNIKPME